MASRITDKVTRNTPIRLKVNGEEVRAYAGETVASVLLMQGIDAFYVTGNGHPRAPYCNMGVCFECRVQIRHQGNKTWVRACMTKAEEEMEIETGLPLAANGDRHSAD
mgnify:CR=1 FL=1